MKLEIKQNLCTILIFTLIMFIPLTFAQQSIGQGGVSGVINASTFRQDLGVADKKSIDAATDYIKHKLGDNYFDRFIRFVSGNSYKTCIGNDCTIFNEVTFNYKKQDLPTTDHLQIRVSVDDKGKVTQYFGPAKAYKFYLSKDDAIAKAYAYGLKNITGAAIFPSHDSEYELVWVVWSNELAEECASGQDSEGVPIPNKLLPDKAQCKKGVYVDVDTSEIRGEFVTNPLIAAASGGIILNKPSKEEKPPEKKEEILVDKTTGEGKSPEKKVAISVNSEEQAQTNVQEKSLPPKQQDVGFFRRIRNWFKGLFS